MLRLSVLLLLLANAGYYAWSHGLLAGFGLEPASQAEPQRVAQQIKPELMRVLSPEEARQLESETPSAQSAASSAGSSTTECLQVGLFNEAQTMVLREQLVGTLPASSWVQDIAHSNSLSSDGNVGNSNTGVTGNVGVFLAF